MVLQKKIKSPTREEIRSLVERVGGAEQLRALLHEFYQVMSKDLMIGFFFDGHDIAHISRKQSEFVLMAAGLIDRFEGKGPSTAHVALPPILQGHFNRRLVILREVLTKAGVATDLIERWVQFEESFRLVVVADP